jgi:hypothetical protein
MPTRNHQLGKNWILLIIPIYAKVSTSIFSKLFIKSVKFKTFTTNNTTNLKNISKYLLTTTLTLGLLNVTNTVIANQNSTIDNYNTRQTPQGRIKAAIF